MDAGETETLKESMSRPNIHFCKISAISEVNHFLLRNAWNIINRIKIISKVRKPVPLK